MKIRISCLDKNEAKKLSSLIFIKESKETYITEILNVIDNEVVISIKDKSAHSVLLKEVQEVEKFTDFIQSVIDNQQKIIETKIFEEQIEITKE